MYKYRKEQLITLIFIYSLQEVISEKTRIYFHAGNMQVQISAFTTRDLMRQYPSLIRQAQTCFPKSGGINFMEQLSYYFTFLSYLTHSWIFRTCFEPIWDFTLLYLFYLVMQVLYQFNIILLITKILLNNYKHYILKFYFF